ncbi:Lithostathine-2, partial [Pseudolycoriella hygida]
MNQVLLIGLFLTELIIRIKCGTSADTPCEGDDWFAFEHEKCFKLVQKTATRYEAERICNADRVLSDDISLFATLATIKSSAEQTFLSELISQKSVRENDVWIGAERMKSDERVVWNDGSSLEFTNWADGNPTKQMGNDCVAMSSSGNTSHNLHKWVDAPCEQKNYFVCQKLQSWLCSCSEIRQDVHRIRNDLKNFRKDSQLILQGLRSELEDLQKNPVPIGFIYVQLPDQPEPFSLWPRTQWENISSTYAGLFFRVLGGNSAAFGETQSENSPRLTELRNIVAGGGHNVAVPSNGDWTSPLWTGSDLSCITSGNPCYWSTQFRQSSGESKKLELSSSSDFDATRFVCLSEDVANKFMNGKELNVPRRVKLLEIASSFTDIAWCILNSAELDTRQELINDVVHGNTPMESVPFQPIENLMNNIALQQNINTEEASFPQVAVVNSDENSPLADVTLQVDDNQSCKTIISRQLSSRLKKPSLKYSLREYFVE